MMGEGNPVLRRKISYLSYQEFGCICPVLFLLKTATWFYTYNTVPVGHNAHAVHQKHCGCIAQALWLYIQSTVVVHRKHCGCIAQALWMYIQSTVAVYPKHCSCTLEAL